MYSSSSLITLNILQLYMLIIVMNSYEFTERRKHFEHVYVESGITIIIQILFYSPFFPSNFDKFWN